MKLDRLKIFGIALTWFTIWPIAARVEQCGSVLTGPEGVLESHGYPQAYPANYNCDWTFQAGREDTVELTFTDFDMEASQGCRYDYLQVFAMGQSPKYCGRGVHKVAPGGILTAKGSVKLEMKSDNSEQKKGFSLRYSIKTDEPEDDDDTVISCATEPCKNGAECVDIDVGEVACFCLDGFEGDFCEINIDDCASDPCENGGTCVDGTNRFSCECLEGFLGPTCGVDVDDCVADPCRNGGTCIDGANSFECQCVTGYTGWNCGQDIDECSSGPCQNMGVCEDRIGFYECVCFPGYTGVNCEIPPSTTAAPETEVPRRPSETESPPPTQPETEAPQPPLPLPTELPESPLPNREDPVQPLHEDPSPERQNEPELPTDDNPSENIRPASHEPDPGDDSNEQPVPDTPFVTDQTTPHPEPFSNTTVENNVNQVRAPEGRNESNDSSTGLIIGIIVGVIGLAAIAVIVIRYWLSKSKPSVKVEPEKIASTPAQDVSEPSQIPELQEEPSPESKKPDLALKIPEVEKIEPESEIKKTDIKSSNLDLLEEDLTGILDDSND